MSTIPNEDECIQILREAEVPDRVIRHVCTVMVLAVEIGTRVGADIELVKAGALLHDLGRSKTHGVMHPVVGAELARSRGLPEPIIKIIQKHIGSGITSDEAKRLGYPPGDYMPRSLEEKVVGMADKLTGDCRYISSDQSLKEFNDKGLLEAGQRMMLMYDELSSWAGMELDDIARNISLNEVAGPCRKFLNP